MKNRKENYEIENIELCSNLRSFLVSIHDATCVKFPNDKVIRIIVTVCRSIYGGERESFIRIYNMKTKVFEQTIRREKDQLTAVAFNYKNHDLIAADDKGRVIVFEYCEKKYFREKKVIRVSEKAYVCRILVENERNLIFNVNGKGFVRRCLNYRSGIFHEWEVLCKGKNCREMVKLKTIQNVIVLLLEGREVVKIDMKGRKHQTKMFECPKNGLRYYFRTIKSFINYKFKREMIVGVGNFVQIWNLDGKVWKRVEVSAKVRKNKRTEIMDIMVVSSDLMFLSVKRETESHLFVLKYLDKMKNTKLIDKDDDIGLTKFAFTSHSKKTLKFLYVEKRKNKHITLLTFHGLKMPKLSRLKEDKKDLMESVEFLSEKLNIEKEERSWNIITILVGEARLIKIFGILVVLG